MRKSNAKVTLTAPGLGVRIGTAAVAAGTIDLLYALGVNAAYGVPPVAVLQFIASGLVGTSAFQAGAASAALGVLSHFGLMTLFAGAVVLVATRLPVRRLNRAVAGAGAGALLYLLMTYVVVPLSRTPPLPPLPVERVVLDILIHVVVVGPIVVLVVLAGRQADVR